MIAQITPVKSQIVVDERPVAFFQFVHDIPLRPQNMAQRDDIPPHEGNIMQDVFGFFVEKMFFGMANVLVHLLQDGEAVVYQFIEQFI